jgi:ribosome assembly protein SQT1
MESAEQVEAMETDGTTAASDTVTGEEDYVDIDDLEEFDDEGPPPSDDDDSGGDMMSDDDEHVQQGAEAEDDLVDEAETVFTGHTDAVYGVTICAAQPDRMATAGGDDVARIWDTNTGECLQMLTGHTDSIACIKFNRDGTLVATGGLDALVMVWRVEDGSLVQTLEGPGEDVTWIDWHSKGNVLVAGSNDCTAWMWNATKGTQMQVCKC